MSKIDESGNAVTEREQTNLAKAAAEFTFSGLRLMNGICLDVFAARFGQSALNFYPQISDWVSEGFMEIDGNRLRLTNRGMMVANSLFVNLV